MGFLMGSGRELPQPCGIRLWAGRGKCKQNFPCKEKETASHLLSIMAGRPKKTNYLRRISPSTRIGFQCRQHRAHLDLHPPNHTSGCLVVLSKSNWAPAALFTEIKPKKGSPAVQHPGEGVTAVAAVGTWPYKAPSPPRRQPSPWESL